MFGSSNQKPSLFGSSNTNSAFGQPSNAGFGVGPSGTTGPFGSMVGPQTQPQPLFGGSSTFASGSSATPLFSSSQPSLFGGTTSAAPATAFGASNTNAFGGSSGSIFGGQQTGSLFGASRFGSSSTTSPFGGSSLAPMPAPTGTTIKFNATQGTDTMMKNGVSQNISTRHQCITCMREYEMKSLEELRLEDYQANRKGPQGLFGANPASSGNLFGTTSSPQNTFAATSNTGLFGKSFGSMTPTTTTSTNTGLFGSSFNKPFFSSSSTSFPTVQSQTPQTTSLFGASSTAPTSLNQTNFFSSGNATNTASVKPIFSGATTQPQNLFGLSNTTTPALGQKPLFGGTTSTAPPFGTTGSLAFNAGNSGTLFSTSQPSLFNTGTTAGTNTAKQPNLFNFQTPTLPLNPPLGGTGVTTGTNLFGSTGTSFSNTGSMFGTTPGTSLFGPTTSFQTPSLQQTVPLQQLTAATSPPSSELLLTRFQTLPYGDSQFFQIDATLSPNTKLKTKFTTDPKTLIQYKISAKSSENKPQRIANSVGRTGTMLFDGLEEDHSEESKTAKDIFVPRRNIKKLVLKPKSHSPEAENTSFTPYSTLESVQRGRVTFDETMPDTTINEFFNRISPKTARSPKVSVSSSSPEKVLEPLTTSGEPEDDENEILLKAPPKCGVILSRSDYYTIPSIEELNSLVDDTNDSCVVDSFTVGRHNYGSIYWEGPLDVKGINLDEIVHIRRKEVIVYPDDDVKPPNGKGLNRSAQITLHQVWPIDKTTHEVIKDLDRLRKMGYAEKIETATIKLGATYKEYRPETGSWVFTVKHFSKYGLSDDEEDEDINEEHQQQAVTQPKQVSQSSEPLSKRYQPESRQDQPAVTLRGDESPIRSSSLAQDNTLHYFLEGDSIDTDAAGDNEVEDSFDYDSRLQERINEVEDMRNALFDADIEETETFQTAKKYKKIPPASINFKAKFEPQIPFFSPKVSQIIPLPIPKKRTLDLKPDTFAAKNKFICDISSVCVSSAPRISFFNGSKRFLLIKNNSVLICNLDLINYDEFAVTRFEEQLKNNSCITSPSPTNHLGVPFIETKEFARNSKNNEELENLVEALYGNLVEVTPYARHQERLNRVQSWLFSCNKKISLPSMTNRRIMHFLSTNELESAVDEALNSREPRLASLISCATFLNKELLVAQLDSWKKSQSDIFIDDEILKIYILLSGQITWNLSNRRTFNVLDGLNWTQQLALMLLFMTPSEVDDQDLGINVLQTFISQMTVTPDDVEYHLLSNHIPWVSLSSCSTLLDSWFLHESLKCYHAIGDSNEYKSDMLHCALASQMMDIKSASFIVLHIRDNFMREMVLKEILAKNASSLDEGNETTKWLLETLMIPSELIAEAIAIKAKSSFDHSKEAVNLIKCGQWANAHQILMEHIFPELVINENHNLIIDLLSQLKPHSHLIPNWFSSGASIYETYLKCLQNASIDDIRSFNVHQLKCSTKRHVLCQSEMARKINIIYSQLSGGTFAYNTPIPDDYALLELKNNAKILLKMLS